MRKWTNEWYMSKIDNALPADVDNWLINNVFDGHGFYKKIAKQHYDAFCCQCGKSFVSDKARSGGHLVCPLMTIKFCQNCVGG